MSIIYRNSLEVSDLELKDYYKWISPITFEEEHLLGRTPEELGKSIFSTFALKGDNVIGCGFVYPSCEDEEMTRWISWRNMKLTELGTLYVTHNHRKDHVASNLIDMRLDYVEEKGYFPVTVTKHKGMPVVLEGKAIRVEDVNGEYSELKSLIRDCHCKTREEMLHCQNCPYDDRILWLYLRFILRKY